MGVFQDLTGQTFCGVKVLRYLGESNWLCECEKCGRQTIRRTTQAKNYGCHCSWRYSVNSDYFKEINTHEKAYFLGFLWADGYNTPEHQLCKVELQKEDVDFLEKFKSAIDFSGRILTMVVKKGTSYRPQDTEVKKINITDRTFVDNLAHKGVVPHREKAHFPFGRLSEEFYYDFIRGYFDGNGCISICNQREVSVTICGGTTLLRDIGNILQNKGIEVRFYHRRPNNLDNITLHVAKNLGKKEFLSKIYGDASVFLNRKYAKYLKAITLL